MSARAGLVAVLWVGACLGPPVVGAGDPPATDPWASRIDAAVASATRWLRS